MNVRWFHISSFVIAVSLVVAERAAGHFDIFLARPATDTKTVIGGADVDALAYDDAVRVFEVELGAVGGEFLALEPGVNHPNINNPALSAYPSSATGLEFGDVLRLKERDFSVDGVVSGLFYWSGVEPVSFAPAAAAFRIDGGDPLGSTAGLGGVFDDHPFLVVDSDVLPGIYLASAYGIVDGFDLSDPVYLVMGTEGLITAEFLGISQDAFDLLTDDEINGFLDEVIELAADYVYATLVVPEPASLGLAAIACCTVLAMARRRRRRLASQ